MYYRLLLSFALSLIMIGACQPLPQSSLSRLPVSPGAESVPGAMSDATLRGRAVFPLLGIRALRVVSASGASPERRVQVAASDVVSYATVSLVDPSLGRTLVTGRTNASGAFILSPDGTFNPPLDSYYYLEIVKRINNNAFGGNKVAMRTVLKWTATGWASLTNGTGGSGDVVVNPTTTAVGLIDSGDAAIGFGDILGKVSGAPDYAAVTSFGTHSAAEVIALADTVTSLLAGGGDPVGDRPVLAGGNLAPDDTGSATIHHDYVKTVGGVASTFVWIPTFTAYQLIVPAGCGGTNTAKPVGYWVATQPSSGVEDTDWAKETFGGFYAAKYEASHADAAQGVVGTGVGATAGGSGTLKVQQRCVPWGIIDWDTAANTCLSYDSHSHLMRDDEWTALAVWSMIHDLTVYGNNAEISSDSVYAAPSDIDDPAVTFLDDPTYNAWSVNGVDRALTGTGKKAAWAGATNLTTHTGTTAGVYDLNGNVWEWTETLGAAITSGNYVVNDITVPVNVPNGYISSLSADSRLRRYGVPGTTTGPTAVFGNDHFWKAAVDSKPIRGASWLQGGTSGIWAISCAFERSGVRLQIGFRPVLRY